MTVVAFAKPISLPKLKRQSEPFLQDQPILYSTPLDPIALHSHGYGGGMSLGA